MKMCLLYKKVSLSPEQSKLIEDHYYRPENYFKVNPSFQIVQQMSLNKAAKERNYERNTSHNQAGRFPTNKSFMVTSVKPQVQIKNSSTNIVNHIAYKELLDIFTKIKLKRQESIKTTKEAAVLGMKMKAERSHKLLEKTLKRRLNKSVDLVFNDYKKHLNKVVRKDENYREKQINEKRVSHKWFLSK